jgi:hypothetical protein
LLLVFLGLFDVIFAVLLLESLYSACGIDKFLLARIERMAHRAYLRVDFFRRAAGLERIAATTMNHRPTVFWMYVFSHNDSSFKTLNNLSF